MTPESEEQKIGALKLDRLFWWLLGVVVIGRLLVLSRFTTHVDDIVPLTKAIENNTNVYSPLQVIRLSLHYTYPPLQFLISLPLAFTLAHDWRELLFWARAVSLGGWVAGVAGGYLFLRHLLGPTRQALAVAGGCLLLFSLRGTAESSQAYNYASTLGLTALLAFVFLTDSSLARMRSSFWYVAMIGLVLGLSVWLTYQAVFAAMGFFMVLGLGCVWRRDWPLLARGIVMGLGLCVGFGLVYHFLLSQVIAWAQTVPTWPGYTRVGTGLGALATYPIRSLWAAAQNNLTCLPWGWPTAAFTGICLLVGTTGVVLGLLRGTFSAGQRRAIFWSACVYAALLSFGYIKAFAFAETRHAFLFQLPLVVWVIVGCSHWDWSRRTGMLILCALLALGGFGVAHYLSISQRRLDLDWVERELKAHPESVIVDMPNDCTWDYRLLAVRDRSLQKRMFAWVGTEHAPQDPSRGWVKLLERSKTVFLCSHRVKMDPGIRALIDRAGPFQISTLVEIDPVSSAEISGIINSGNGFYFYRLERR